MLSPDKINMFSSCMFALPAAVAVTLGPAGRGLATGTSSLAVVAAVGLGPAGFGHRRGFRPTLIKLLTHLRCASIPTCIHVIQP